MNTRTTASLKSFAKYLLWTGIAAAAVAAGNNLGNAGIPDFVIPIVGALLKALATFAATEAKEGAK